MKKLKLKANAFQGNALSREQLKKVLGGVTGSGGDCGESECTSDSNCSSKFPTCLKATCLSTGQPVNTCICKTNPQGC